VYFPLPPENRKVILEGLPLRLSQNFSFGKATFENSGFVDRRPKNRKSLSHRTEGSHHAL
jgi:hypothetical protein